MPRGTRHEIVGVLMKDGSATVLEVDGGGTWRLDLGWRSALRGRGMIGLRVRVGGVRDDFDLLAVERIERV